MSIRGGSPRQSGFTIIEMTFVSVLMILLAGSAVSAFVGVQNSFLESEILSQLTLRTQHTMERLVEASSQALTVDPQFSPLLPDTGIGSHGLRFRTIQAVVMGNPVYDDALRYYVLGPDSGAHPCAGVIIGRGPDMSTIYTMGRGPDGLLGTTDDTRASISGGVPAVELLLPSTFAPQTGEMLQIDVDAGRRLLTFTLRANARNSDGNFLLPNDLVLVERVSLLQ